MIYSRFDLNNDVVTANPTVVTTGLWSGDTGSLETTLYLNGATGQQAVISGEYYLDVYDKDPTNPLAEVQFAVAYGHINGGGAPSLLENDQATLPTKAIYSQYKNLLLDPSDTKFTFQGEESDHIYVINFQRSRTREQLDPGNWQLPLSGHNGVFTFIDDSNQTLGALTANSKAGRVFNIISGALFTVSGSVSSSTNATTFSGSGYGLVYPDLGIVVLNPNAITPMVGFYGSGSDADNPITSSFIGRKAYAGSEPVYTSTNVTSNAQALDYPYSPVTSSYSSTTWGSKKSSFNHLALYISINKALQDINGAGFRARSAETISSTHYFVRLRNKEFNYSNNPTFYNADNGSLVRPEFRNDPKVYITTVGLYNDQNELLAVAKLSKPVRKSFDEEVLLRVRLDF